jgi:tetratricopeptide (TPR) repeat protein
MSRRSPTLALCVIAKDEERFIADCLDSARRFVDEVVVVDTGSTDRTREIAREHGARVEEFVWIDDFAAARNAAIEAATADWILMLDADERLDAESGQALRRAIRRAPTQAHALSPLIQNRDVDGKGARRETLAVPRIFPRRRDLRFVGAIHEVIAYLPDPKHTLSVPAPQIRIIHYGYDGTVYAERHKDARNLALIERELERGNNDPRLPFFLLQQHVVAGRNTEAVDAFDRALECAPRLPRAFVVESYHLLALALRRLNRRDALERAVEQAAQADVLGHSALDVLSDFYAEAGDLDQAIKCLERQLEPRLPAGLEDAVGSGGWATRLALANLHAQNGNPRLALEQLEQAYPELPADTNTRSVAIDAGIEFSMQIDDFESAARWLARSMSNGPDRLEEHRRRFDLIQALYARAPRLSVESPWADLDRAFAERDLQRMYDLACGLSPTRPGDLVRLLAVIGCLRELEEHDAVLNLLNRALDGPPIEAVYWLLIQTLSKLGRYDDAQLAAAALQKVQHSVGRAA